MGNRTAKFISALVGSIIAGAPLAAVSQNAPSPPSAASTTNAASDCLTSPKGAAPQGQHWFYRLERATKRQCWYLRAEAAKDGKATTQAASSTPDSPPPQSVQNARAEYIAPQSTAAPAAATAPTPAQPAPAAGGEPGQPAVTTRWPDAAAAAPAQQPAAEPAAAQPDASPAPVALAAADVPAEKPTGSLPTLLLVIGGALALAGLLGSVIYRFAGGRVRVQTADRRINWDNGQDPDDSRAPWRTEPVPTARLARPLPVDFDAMRSDAMRSQARQIDAFSDASGRIAAQDRPAKVAAPHIDATEIDYFDGEFEIAAAAPQLAAEHIQHEEPAVHDETPRADNAGDHNADDEDAVDIDVITAMLERLASEGPRLTQPSFEPSLEADLAALARSSRGRSAARA
ncbi:hypothetical protein G8O24_02495 [Bradyrhizobium sp. INPA01-394B]|uniref:Uncharacterized protein n=1 Tax=Bradyrhizobium campsiandrae TaxID=1729892 RepID=A0ABR7U2N9_9BRAD|nr:hypothetical protein [Bradyrhizobium campsiandrae]MBC9876212.1 hypothetical protein [Bradyrhizobium campsiandrae]MBC9977848.1 hypothetical protein [Bradyrhizobium campsiandrae]